MPHLPWDYYLDGDKASQDIFEYLQSFKCSCSPIFIDCGCTRRRLDLMFYDIYGFLEQLRIEINKSTERPELRVRHSEKCGSEASESTCIYVDTGLIKHCLNAFGGPLFPILGFELPKTKFNKQLLGITALRWIIAHEYRHMMDHPPHLWTDSITAHALETDADMCATATIYRAFQNMYGHVTNEDNNFKCLVFYYLFSILRPLTTHTQSATHPSLSMRLWFIRNKLASLRANPSHLPDIDLLSDETRESSVRLTDCLIKCEKMYQANTPNAEIKFDFGSELIEILDHQLFSPITKRWDEICHLVRPPVIHMMKRELLKKTFCISVDGIPRRILSFTEMKGGDIYVRLFSGTQIGVPPDQIRILNDKYSVHPSRRSLEYNTIKKTLSLENGFKTTSAFLTNAIKSIGVFAHIFSCRMTDLKAPIYYLDEKNSKNFTSLGNIDVSEKVLLISLVVTNPLTEFPDFIENGNATQLIIGEVKFIILRSYESCPALACAWTIGKITSAPELIEDETAREDARNHLKGVSLEQTLENVNSYAEQLMENYFITLHNMTDDPQIRKEIKEIIDSFPKVAGIQLGWHNWEKSK